MTRYLSVRYRHFFGENFKLNEFAPLEYLYSGSGEGSKEYLIVAIGAFSPVSSPPLKPRTTANKDAAFKKKDVFVTILKDILTKMLNDKDDGEFWAGGT
ncbi:hypothetical protein [Brevibacillus sp. SIMBA_040]|uniref:hypothetical protein n=1 Tax=unclassified Brevibacillus TaxID=2684853 RepID=UPI00397A40A8